MSGPPVVILIHGIRTAASWQNRIAALIEGATGATVVPVKYGYFDVLRFWCPFGFCRSGPIERLRQEIEAVASSYKDRPLIVFAHSYGTYALTRVIEQNPFFRFDRIILCGSVVPLSYDWRKVVDQIRGEEKRNAIINECGTRDIWPVLAQAVTWGYGATGTYGFGTFAVRDRFHDLAHSDFFTDDFARRYWVPLVRGESVAFSDQDVAGKGAPGWFNLFRLPLKWAALVGLAAALALLFYLPSAVASCKAGEQRLEGGCVDTSAYASQAELRRHITELIRKSNRVLDLKASELFPLMDAYTADPTPERWQSVMEASTRLLGLLQDGFAEIDRNASFKESNGSVYYLTNDAVIPVDRGLYDAFVQVYGYFNGRKTIIAEMAGAGEQPPTDLAAAWKLSLLDLHVKLDRTLDQLLAMLTGPNAPPA